MWKHSGEFGRREQGQVTPDPPPQTTTAGPRWKENNWTVNFDGTRDETGLLVKGAVDEFAARVGRQVSVTYREGAWNSWMIRK